MTDITIVATTWLPPGKEDERLKDFMKSIVSWLSYLRYDDGDINLHIADDGTSDEWFEKLKRAVQFMWHPNLTDWVGDVTFSRQERHGVGASLNAGLKQAFSQGRYAFYTVDDWVLLSPLDLTTWVKFMEDDNYAAGMVRFFPHPDLTGTFKHIPPYGWATILDHHHYVFATRPCLWHERFFEPQLRGYGWFKEDCSALETEHDFNARILTWPYRYHPGKEIWMAIPALWQHIDAFSLSDVVPTR